MQQHRFQHNCYIMLKTIDEFGSVTRASKVKDFVCKTYGPSNVRISQEVGNCNIFLSGFKQPIKAYQFK